MTRPALLIAGAVLAFVLHSVSGGDLPGAPCSTSSGVPSAAEVSCAWADGASRGSSAARSVNRWLRGVGVDPGPSISEVTGGRPECADARRRGDWDASAAAGC